MEISKQRKKLIFIVALALAFFFRLAFGLCLDLSTPTSDQKQIYLLGLKFFTEHFHQHMCQFMQDPSRYRKLILAPRDHGKTMCVKAQILHALIQPADHNIYFPGVRGTELRIVLAGESLSNVSRHLEVIKTYIMKNVWLHTLWPHLKPGSRWSSNEIVVERDSNYSEPTIEAVGTETALASRHVDWLFEEDLFTFKAMLSATLANRCITWHQAAEGVLDEYENAKARETVTGTPWSQNDLYNHIISNESDQAPDLANTDEEIRNDPSLFAVYTRSAIENDKPLWPERFSFARLRRIERRLRGTGLFELNFLCNYKASTLVDFQEGWLRYFTLKNDMVYITAIDGTPIGIQDRSVLSPVASSVAELMKQRGHVSDTELLDTTESATVQATHKATSLNDVETWLKEVLR